MATPMVQSEISPTSQEVIEATGTQIFDLVGSSEFPMICALADSLSLQLILMVVLLGTLAFSSDS